MKKSKHFLSMLLAVCLVLGLIPGKALAVGGNLPFTDVNTADWFYDAVQHVYEKGMMSGISTTTFSPNDTTTRGMIVTVLHHMEGTPSTSGTAFTDVPAGRWYSDAVAWASTNGVVAGYGNGMFGPGNAITREQMATILHRYSQHKGYDTSASGNIASFPDAAQVSSYAIDSMNWAIGNGLISGVDNNTLAPKDNATRAQIATILKRYCENVVPASTSDPDTSLPDTTPSRVNTTYTVTFDLNYGNDTQYKKVTVKAGETVSKPSNPSRSGYSFSGWYSAKSGGSQFDLKKGIAEDLTLYAHWSKKSNGGGNGNNSNSESFTPPETNPPETTTHGEITYKAPTESDIDSGIIEYEGQTYTARYVNNQLVIVVNDGVNYNEAKKLVEAYDASIVGKIETIGVYQIEFDSAKTMTELNAILDDLKENRAVEDAYLNTVLDYEATATQYYPNDTWDIPDTEIQWAELDPNGNNWGAEAINAPSAWKILIDKYGRISQIPSVHVGVIDKYIDITHDDLNVNALYWYQNGLNSFKKDQTETTAADCAAAAENGKAFEDCVHGTHVMGTIGATFDGVGINGIALNPELYGVSVAEATKNIVYTRFGCSTALSKLIEDSKCQVINYSMEYSDYSITTAMDDGEKVATVLKKYLNKNYDFLIVAAAGNHKDRSAQYSGFFNAVSDETVKSHIIVVGNAKYIANGKFALNSGQAFGSRVDVVAPGTDIYSTVSQNTRSFVGYAANSKYAKLTGTSMAAPHVSGVAALVWAANPSLTGDRVKNIILETANIVVSGNDANGYSHNMVNAAYAVSKALGVEYTMQGECGENMTWTLDTTRHLTIQGTGEMTWESEYAPWHRYYEMIGNVKIGDGITSIYQEAFKDCNRVIKVELGHDIKSIGDYAFIEMSGLHSIEIPNSIQKIGKQALGYKQAQALEDDNNTPINGFTIYGYSGTAAETYAYDEAHDGKFVFRDLTPTPPDPKRTFQLTVTDLQTGKPLSDAAVTLSGRSHDTESYRKLTSGSTDAKGMFRADVEGTYTDLRADVVKDGYIAGAVETTETTTSLSLSKDPGQIDEPAPPSVEIPEGYTPIYTFEDLVATEGSGNVILMNDISCPDGYAPFDDWYGVMEGNGHSISNLKPMNAFYDERYGGWLLKNEGTIRNVRFKNADLDFTEGMPGIALIAENSGTVENCTLDGRISLYRTVDFESGVGYHWAGGFAIVNYDGGKIMGCVNRASVTAIAHILSQSYVPVSISAAGICTENFGTVERCLNLGNIAVEARGHKPPMQMMAYGIDREYSSSLHQTKGVTSSDCGNAGSVTTFSAPGTTTETKVECSPISMNAVGGFVTDDMGEKRYTVVNRSELLAEWPNS